MEPTTSDTKQKDFGTVGTVTPYCTRRARGNNNERARGDFPENGGQLSQTVPKGQDDAGRPARMWDIMRDRFPLGHPTELGVVEAPSYKRARELGEARWGKPIVVLARSRKNSGVDNGRSR